MNLAIAFVLIAVSVTSAAESTDQFKIRFHLPKIKTTCEIYFVPNTDPTPRVDRASHLIYFVPLKSRATPSKWETDAAQIRIFEDDDRIRSQQSAFTLVPEGMKNRFNQTHGALLRAMFEQLPDRPFPDLYERAGEFFAAQSVEDQELIRQSLAVLETGSGGRVMSARFLVQHRNGRLFQFPSGFDLILPDAGAPRGLVVMPYLQKPAFDFMINFEYRAGPPHRYKDHFAAIVPVATEGF